MKSAHGKWSKLRLGWTAVTATTLALFGQIIGTSPAFAAAAQPDFKLPFACGQTWQASTYNYYAGIYHGNAVDFNLPSAEDRGQPVLAAAAGVVETTVPGSGRHSGHSGGGCPRVGAGGAGLIMFDSCRVGAGGRVA